MEVSSRAPPGITAVVPSCCFVFFLYPFSTSTPPLKLAVKKKKKTQETLNLSSYLSGSDDLGISQSFSLNLASFTFSSINLEIQVRSRFVSVIKQQRASNLLTAQTRSVRWFVCLQ